ncbi:hypothetical protein Syun_003450 [Stephania yunnanensis]|uniref:Uncharacterized protein n=1 Tax=Stephania yunnanensis TaxID=152371 RepID=A0AAP0Q084_9MAGN
MNNSQTREQSMTIFITKLSPIISPNGLNRDLEMSLNENYKMFDDVACQGLMFHKKCPCESTKIIHNSKKIMSSLNGRLLIWSPDIHM